MHPPVHRRIPRIKTANMTWPHQPTPACSARYDTNGPRSPTGAPPTAARVWEREGTLADVIDGLIELPAPDEPGTPRLVTGRRPILWTPR